MHFNVPIYFIQCFLQFSGNAPEHLLKSIEIYENTAKTLSKTFSIHHIVSSSNLTINPFVLDAPSLHPLKTSKNGKVF